MGGADRLPEKDAPVLSPPALHAAWVIWKKSATAARSSSDCRDRPSVALALAVCVASELTSLATTAMLYANLGPVAGHLLLYAKVAGHVRT